MFGWVNKKTVVTSVITAAIIAGGSFQLQHYASAQDTEDLAKQSAETQIELVEIVKNLAARAVASDIEEEQDRKRCLACQIKDPAICGIVGVEVCE